MVILPSANIRQELIEYVRRVLGYSLTGSVQEHALFFCYGTGGNQEAVRFSDFVRRWLNSVSVQAQPPTSAPTSFLQRMATGFMPTAR